MQRTTESTRTRCPITMDSTAAGDPPTVAFLPFAAAGHLIPLMNTARLFTRHGADVAFITTPATARRLQNDVALDSRLGHPIKIHTLQFPFAEFGLPPDLETFTEAISPAIASNLGAAFESLRPQTEHLLRQIGADCIVSDTILHWTTEAAARLGVPRLVFRASGAAPECLSVSVTRYKPHEKVGSEEEPFLLPGLPHNIEMSKSQLPFWLCTTNEEVIEIRDRTLLAEKQSHGVLMNTFFELEPDYVEFYKQALGFRTWVVGPVSFWVNKSVSEEIGVENYENEENTVELMEWLNSKELNSVLYVCFGSSTKFWSAQLAEIAGGLEDSGHQFVWVVGKVIDSGGDHGQPFDGIEEFEERMKQSKRGLIVRTWAPQQQILNHPAVGGFITHCGWNSILEGVCGGRPMVAWPSSAEQFFNEKLITEVLKIGVSVGAKKARGLMNLEAVAIVGRDEIAKAVSFLMGDEEEAVGMRNRVREMAVAAERATNSGGSSHTSLLSLIHELKMMKLKRQANELHA